MIELKWIGGAAIFIASTWAGVHASIRVRAAVSQLAQIKLSLEIMECEISYAKTSILQLCRILYGICKGPVAEYYRELETLLSRQDASVRNEAVTAFEYVPHLELSGSAIAVLTDLFSRFGSYGSAEQIQQIKLALRRIDTELNELESQKKSRCRCYEILGVCAGLSVVFLVI